MERTTSRIISLLLPGLLLLAACDDKRGGSSGGKEGEGEQLAIDEQTASLNTVTNLRHVLTSFADSIGYVGETTIVEELGRLLADEDEVAQAAPEEPSELDDEPVEGEQDLQSSIDEAVDWLEEHVFARAESATETAVYYRLDPALCEEIVPREHCIVSGGADDDGEWRDLPEEGCDDGSREADVQECQEFLTEVPLRIEVVSRAEGDVDLTLLVDDDELRTMSLYVHRTSLAYQIDLAATKTALERVLQALSEDEAAAKLPSVLEGVVRAELAVTGEEQVRLSWSVSRALRVVLEQEDGRYRLELAPSTWNLAVDGVARTLTGEIDLGSFDLELPYQAFINGMWEQEGAMPSEAPAESGNDGDGSTDEEEPPQVAGQLLLHLAGLTGASTLQDGPSEQLQLTGLGLGNGTSWVRHDGDTLVSVDVNARSGRTYDLTITVPEPAVDSGPNGSGDEAISEDGTLPTLAFRPGLDLSLLFNAQTIAQDLREVPQALLDETWRLLLDGAPQPTVRLRDAAVDGGLTAAVEVLAGRLTLSSTALDDPLVVDQGMCLAVPDGEDSDTPPDGEEAGEWIHPFSEIQSVACPPLAE